MLLSRIDDSKIRKFKNDCLARGVKKVSINTYLRHLRGFFNKAHAWGELKNKLPIEFFKLPKRHPRTLNPDEIDILLKHSYHCHFEMHRVIKFALWTGCRREEMHTLTWQRVKADTCTVIGKGNKERTIPLLPESIEALGTPKDIGYVFYHPHIDKYSKDFKSIARDCSIDDISLHKLRHTAATQMLASGIPLEYVQEILGHEDISTTRIYAKILQDRLKQEMKKMKY
jgi:integrase